MFWLHSHETCSITQQLVTIIISGLLFDHVQCSITASVIDEDPTHSYMQYPTEFG